MEFKQQQYALISKKVIENMKRRNFDAYYCETKEDALAKALELIGENDLISWGGSATTNEIGLNQALRQGGYKLIDRDAAKDAEELHKMFHEALSCDCYITGTNAITVDGKLVNMDGNGNRTAALIYGPKSILVIVGMNKLVSDEQSGIKRIKEIAAPRNAMRLNLKTPCTQTGFCADCSSDDRVCCQLLVTHSSRIPGRIKVILIGEDLGF